MFDLEGSETKCLIRRLKLHLVTLSFRWHHCHLLLFAQCWQRAAAKLCLPRTLLLVRALALQPHISSALCTWYMGLGSGLWGCGLCSQGVAAAGRMLRLVLCFLTEIEAKKACDWLRAAGFPQYAQLYEGESCLLPLTLLSTCPEPLSHPDSKGGAGTAPTAPGRGGERGDCSLIM